MSIKRYTVVQAVELPSVLRPAKISPLVRRIFGHNPKDQGLQEIFLMRIVAKRKSLDAAWHVEFWVKARHGKNVQVGAARYASSVPRDKVLEIVNKQLRDQGEYRHRPPKELRLEHDDPDPDNRSPGWVVGYTTLTCETP